MYMATTFNCINNFEPKFIEKQTPKQEFHYLHSCIILVISVASLLRTHVPLTLKLNI